MVRPNGQEEETVQEAASAATSGEPVPATEAPVLIAGPSGAPSASGAQPAVVVRTRQRRGSSSSVPVGNTTRAHPPFPSQLTLPIVPPATGVRTSVPARITQTLPPSGFAVPASHRIVPSTVTMLPPPSVAQGASAATTLFPSTFVVGPSYVPRMSAWRSTAPPPTCSVPVTMPSSVVLGGTTYYSSAAPIPPAASAIPTVPVSHAAHVHDYADDWCHLSTRPSRGNFVSGLNRSHEN